MICFSPEEVCSLVYKCCCKGFLSSCPEMEFLDISLTKDSSLLHAINSLSTGKVLKKTRLYRLFVIIIFI